MKKGMFKELRWLTVGVLLLLTAALVVAPVSAGIYDGQTKMYPRTWFNETNEEGNQIVLMFNETMGSASNPTVSDFSLWITKAADNTVERRSILTAILSNNATPHATDVRVLTLTFEGEPIQHTYVDAKVNLTYTSNTVPKVLNSSNNEWGSVQNMTILNTVPDPRQATYEGSKVTTQNKILNGTWVEVNFTSDDPNFEVDATPEPVWSANFTYVIDNFDEDQRSGNFTSIIKGTNTAYNLSVPSGYIVNRTAITMSMIGGNVTDSADRKLVAFTDEDVTNLVPHILNCSVDAWVGDYDGSFILVNFTQNMTAPINDVHERFNLSYVQDDETKLIGFDAIALESDVHDSAGSAPFFLNRTYNLTLSEALPSAELVSDMKLNYTRSTDLLVNVTSTDGTHLRTFGDNVFTGDSKTVDAGNLREKLHPTFDHASVPDDSGMFIWANFSRAMNISTLENGDVANFTIMVNDVDRSGWLTKVSVVNEVLGNHTINLTLSDAIQFGDEVTLSYPTTTPGLMGANVTPYNEEAGINKYESGSVTLFTDAAIDPMLNHAEGGVDVIMELEGGDQWFAVSTNQSISLAGKTWSAQWINTSFPVSYSARLGIWGSNWDNAPAHARFVKTLPGDGGKVGYTFVDGWEANRIPTNSKTLYPGWNLVSSGSYGNAYDVLSTIKGDLDDKTLVGQKAFNTKTFGLGTTYPHVDPSFLRATTKEGLDDINMSPFDAFWLYMDGENGQTSTYTVFCGVDAPLAV